MTNDITTCVNGATNKFTVVQDSTWDWVLKQSPVVVRLWMQASKCDPFGDRFVPLETDIDISTSTFRKCKKLLEDSGMFEFESVSNKLSSGQKKIQSWKVRNLLGSKVKNKLATQDDKLATQDDKLEAKTLTQQAFQNPSLSTSISTSLINKEKEINNISTSSQEYIYKNNISTKRVREESELDPRCDEPSLEATAHRDYLQEKESLSASQADIVENQEVELSVPEMAAIVKSEYPNLLPAIPEGFKRKAFKLLENGLEKLFVFDLLETEIEAVLAILDEYGESGDSNPVIRFLEEFAFAVVAKFRFEGFKVREYSLCG
jgi:hypothetical protein